MTSPLYQDTITIFNRYQRGGFMGGIPPAPSWDRTVIRNVTWQDQVHTNMSSAGSSVIDKTVSVIIPLNAEIEGNKKYFAPMDYALMPNDQDGWTLQQRDIIAFGEIDRDITPLFTEEDLAREYKTMRISGVTDTTNQSMIPSWKVEGV